MLNSPYRKWIIVGSIILAIVFLIFWLKPDSITEKMAADNAAETAKANAEIAGFTPDSVASNFASESQKDTAINCQLTIDNQGHLVVNAQTRDCFEYFLTQIGEVENDQIAKNFVAYIKQTYKQPAQSEIIDLWGRYIKYRQSTESINKPTADPEKTPSKYYRQIFDQIQQLRQNFFSRVEIEGLFGTEDEYHQYTLDRMEVFEDDSLSESEKAAKLRQLLQGLDEEWRANIEQLSTLENLRKLTAEIKAEGGNAQQLREMRLSLVGPEATQRLEALDISRSQFKQQVDNYLSQRKQILQSTQPDSAKQASIQQLRDQMFDKKSQLRLEAYEESAENAKQ